jgi:hypothetical protein
MNYFDIVLTILCVITVLFPRFMCNNIFLVFSPLGSTVLRRTLKDPAPTLKEYIAHRFTISKDDRLTWLVIRMIAAGLLIVIARDFINNR